MILRNKILSLLLNNPKNYWDLLNETNVLIRDLISILSDLYRNGYIVCENDIIYLTEAGKEYSLKCGIKPFIGYRCMPCNGRTIDINDLPHDILNRYYKIQINRPQSIPQVDQGYVTPEVSLLRGYYIQEKGDIENCSIIFIGDDDLTSIAIALLGNYKQITVLDIDSRLIDFITKIVNEENFPNFNAYTYDVREDLPDSFKESFDVFFTDPPETKLGFTSFINRGIQSLKGKGCVGYFNLTYMEASLEKWYLFEKNLIEAGFIITDILEKFNLYNLPNMQKGKGYKVIDSAPFSISCCDKLWYNSSLFRIYSANKLKIINNVPNIFKEDKDFYLDEDGYVVSL